MLPLSGEETPHQDLIETLPMLQRLALSYAPRAARGPTLELFALDTRLAGIVRSASEPIMAQLRLAWWRERFESPVSRWPEGEPLLAALRGWNEHRDALVSLVDGWEELTAAPPLAAAAMTALAEARGGAFAALAESLGAARHAEAARRAGTDWAIADLAGKLRDPGERDTVLALAGARDLQPARLPRALRPLKVLHGLALRSLRADAALDAISPGAALAALRLGLLGC